MLHEKFLHSDAAAAGRAVSISVDHRFDMGARPVLTLREGFRHNADGTFLRYDTDRGVLIAGARVDGPPAEGGPESIAAMRVLAERLNKLCDNVPFKGLDARFQADDYDGTLLLYTEVELAGSCFTTLVLTLARLRRAAEHWASLRPGRLSDLRKYPSVGGGSAA